MAKRKPATAKKPRGKRAAKRVAERAGVRPKSAPKAKAPVSAKAGTARAGRAESSGEAIPAPEVSLSQIDTLTATVEAFAQLMVLRLDSIESRLEGIKQQHGPRQAAPPAVPPPGDPAFAVVAEFMAELRAEIRSIRKIVQQPPSRADRDVPTLVARARRVFAGACKTLGIVGPTPAVIGRVMHDRGIFSAEDNRPPRAICENIYAKGKHHLTSEICHVLELVGKGKDSSKIAELLGKEFDTRFALLTNTGYGQRQPLKTGRKINYRRHLTPQGRELFDGWPKWADATGGISAADEPDSPSEPSTTTEPDASATGSEPPPSPPPLPPSPPPA